MDGAAQIRDFAGLYTIYSNDSFSKDFSEIAQTFTDLNDKKPGESEISNLKAIIDRKKEQLNNLLSQIDKISPLIGSKASVELRFIVNQSISSLDTLNLKLDDYSNDMSVDNWNEVIRTYNGDYQVKSGMLHEGIMNTQPKFVESIVAATQYNQITPKELEEMLLDSGLPDIAKDLIRDALDQIKDIQIEQVDTNGNEELTKKAEEEKGEASIPAQVAQEEQAAPAVVTEAQVAEPVRQSLEERLNGITYEQGMVYASAVNQVRTDFEVGKLDERIEALTAKREKSKKGKLSFKEAVELQQLINQREMLKEAEYNLSRKEQRVEDKLAKKDEEATAQKSAIAAEQARQAEAESRLFKYISARRERKLQAKLYTLQEKVTTMEMQQRTSALVNFDKTNARIVKKARKEAKKQVRQERHQQRVEAFNQFRNEVVSEAKAIRRDAERFAHRPDMVQQLQAGDRPLIMTGQPGIIYLPERMDMEMGGPALAA